MFVFFMIHRLSIIIPAYNEEATILAVLQKMTEIQLISGIEKELIIIDDCSKDDTRRIVNEFAESRNDLVIFHQPVNQGKGAAVRKGIELAKGDFLIFQDADLELDPEDINILLAKAMETKSQVVYGSRLLTAESRSSFNPNSLLANRFLTWLSNVLNGTRITDMETCYKLIETPLAKSLQLKEERFGFEPEITAKLAKKKIQFEEVPISYVSRTKEDGKKIGYKDGIRAIYCILRYGLLK